MASRVGRQVFSSTARAARSVRSTARPSKRFMSADAAAHHDEPFKPKSDLPWIIAAAAVTGPALAYLLKDTFEIKKRIAAGHHGHDAHDAHAAHTEAHEEHATPAVMKDDEGTEADVSSAVNDATAADVPNAADAVSISSGRVRCP
ncbi:hypothetical protein DFH07DRAFT_818869 [Mycena maculata]|uniref:Uncharacterized protein n=1 Tax=Mycena maculata TaxID=230809 RepID=A0AAD7J6P5_9AGAR|nr:hypothetical protein DFH07DRAFT_818869 [Mycena maculata]